MQRFLAVVAGGVLAVSVPLAAGQDTKTVRGAITAITPTTITMKAEGKDITFNVDAKTDITARGASTATRAARAEGKPGPTLDQIVKVGQPVEVRYSETGMRAASIRVLPAGASLNAPPPPPPPARTATGIVTSLTGSSLTVKGREGELTFVISPKTEVVGRGLGTKTAEKKAAGEKTTIADLVGSGDSVTVRYTEADGAKSATQVTVTRKAATR